ncbi:hypothetical protein GIB67_015832, partial [Kingdonia uniflora]
LLSPLFSLLSSKANPPNSSLRNSNKTFSTSPPIFSKLTQSLSISRFQSQFKLISISPKTNGFPRSFGCSHPRFLKQLQ